MLRRHRCAIGWVGMICRVRHALFQKPHHGLLLTNRELHLRQQSCCLFGTVAPSLLRFFRLTAHGLRSRHGRTLCSRLLLRLSLGVGTLLFSLRGCCRSRLGQLFLFLKVEVVITLVILYLTVFDFPNAVRYLVHEITVMAYYQNSAIKGLQGRLHRLACHDIKMVGGLVQHEAVGAVQHQL